MTSSTGSFHANAGKKGGVRDPVDRYETPDSVTEALLRRISLPKTVREPACGTGRMVRVLEKWGHDVDGTDLMEDKLDFLRETCRSEAIVTNPPYRGGLAGAFARHALKLCDGPVAMLMRTGFLHSENRFDLFDNYPPSGIFYISRRIFFFHADGTRIKGQTHDHCWVVWNCDDAPALSWIGPEETLDARRNG